MDLNTLMQEIRTLWRRVAGLEARVANLPVRPAVGGAKVTYTAATYGHYYLDTDGSYVLLLYNEAPAQEDCS
jgi:hypothetical protein